MIGWQFNHYWRQDDENPFDKLFKLFKELLVHTAGDVAEAFSWLTELDKQYHLTDDSYGIADFIEDLRLKGYISTQNNGGQITEHPTSKMETALRKQALDEIFDQLKKSKQGNHSTRFPGQGDETISELRGFEYGDRLEHIAMSETLRTAQINHGIDSFMLTEKDIQVHETYYKSQTSTVLMIDISHSMILYGEDRITPAKKVAMALSELILTRYPKDTLDVIVFGDDAWSIEIRDLPYLQVGPYHTNTVAGLELAMDLLRKRKNPNKQIMMITDGKPTCIKKGKNYYKNPFGLDRKILNRTLALAVSCRKIGIPITTFMIARDPYLVHFVDQFTKANNGKAFYSSLQGLGEFIFMDYQKTKEIGEINGTLFQFYFLLLT
ncbi:MAG: von Willebrand factor A [Bacteroidetes bacterium OLB9]|nr:MAG: von Willebrand factor A [Bacteroidetes bacterium OLB9]